MIESSQRLCVVLSIAWLTFSCDGTEQPVESVVAVRPVFEAGPFLESMGRAEGVEGSLVLDHALRMESIAPETLIVMASSPKRRLVSIFESDPGVEEASPTGPVGYRTVLTTSLPYHSQVWNRPDMPELADMDGDGRPELLLGFRTVLADRTVHSILVCAKAVDGWHGFPSPPLIATVRAHFGNVRRRVGIFQEDKMNAVEVSGREMYLRGLSMGGEWRLERRSDGMGSNLLGIGILTDSGAAMSEHRVAMAMYRFTGDGYALDPDWNGGRVPITDSLIPPGPRTP